MVHYVSSGSLTRKIIVFPPLFYNSKFKVRLTKKKITMFTAFKHRNIIRAQALLIPAAGLLQQTHPHISLKMINTPDEISQDMDEQCTITLNVTFLYSTQNVTCKNGLKKVDFAINT